MAINKVVYDNQVLIDITDTTVAADKMVEGVGAYGADGTWIEGTLTEWEGGSY